MQAHSTVAKSEGSIAARPAGPSEWPDHEATPGAVLPSPGVGDARLLLGAELREHGVLERQINPLVEGEVGLD